MGNPGRIEMGIWIKVFRVQEKGLECASRDVTKAILEGGSG